METMDTLKVTKRLVAAGATQKLAEEVVKVVKEATDIEKLGLATKKDLNHLRGDIKKDLEHFKDNIKEGQKHFVTKDDLHKASNKIVWAVIVSVGAATVFITKNFPFISNLFDK